MLNPGKRLHLEIQQHRAHPIGIIRSSFRDPDTQAVKHTQHGRLTGLFPYFHLSLRHDDNDFP